MSNHFLPPATGTMLSGQQVVNRRFGTVNQKPLDAALHPHLFDVYRPDMPPGQPIKIVVCGLGGGQSTPPQLGGSLKAFQGSQILAHCNFSVLRANACELWIPQQQACTGITDADSNPNGVDTRGTLFPNGVFDWNNRTFYSQAYDNQMLQDWCIMQGTTYPTALRMFVGHSEGAIMTGRMMHEQLSTGPHACFMTAGPEDEFYTATPGFSGITSPFYMRHGYLDDILADTTLTPPVLGTEFFNTTWNNPNIPFSIAQRETHIVWIGAWLVYQSRLTAYYTSRGLTVPVVTQASGVVTTIPIGTKTTWTDLAGNCVMDLLSVGTHHQPWLQQCMGNFLIDEACAFVTAHHV